MGMPRCLCRRRAQGRAAVLAALLALAAGTALAQDDVERLRLQPPWLPQLTQAPPPLQPADPGATPAPWHAWSAAYLAPGNTGRRELRLTAAEVETWDRQLRELRDTLRRAPVLRDAHVVRLWSSSGSVGAGDTPQALGGHLMIGAWIAQQLRPQPDGSTKIAGETAHLLVGLNRLPVTPGPPWMRDADGEFFPLLRLPSPWPGTQIVGRALLVLPAGKPESYLPVSRERVLRALVASLADEERSVQAQLRARREQLELYLGADNAPRRRAEIEQATRGFMNANRQDEATARARAEAIDRAHVEQLRREAEPPPDDPLYTGLRTARAAREALDRMTAAERAAPAWVGAAPSYPYWPLLREPGSPGALPVVRLNPDFFDRRLPRTALQGLTVEGVDAIAERAHRPPVAAGPVWDAAVRANLLILQQTDWAALARERLR